MRIAALPGDYGACGLYRVINPIRALQAQGETEIEAVFGSGLQVRLDPDGNVIHVPPLRNADAILLQRPMSKKLVQSLSFIKEQGVKIVVDLDDDIELTHPDNAAHWQVNPRYSPEQNWDWLWQACKLADLVTVSTPALLRYAKYSRGVVLPNLIPAQMLAVERPPDQYRLGWSGTLAVHPHDLQVTGGQVAQVVKETGCGFHVVGDPAGVQGVLRLPEPPTSSGWVLLEHYPAALSQLSVGIAPLEQSRFNQAKSALKGLEMASLGIPFVASPTEDYRRINRLGIGELAKRPGDWYRKVKRLVEDRAYREDAGQAARQRVAEQCTLERNVHLWAEAWTSVLERPKIGVA